MKILDPKRLGKQRVEANQILKILLGETTSNAWRNHPAVRMWKGFEFDLIFYYNISLYEWRDRGYKNIKLQPREFGTTFDTSSKLSPPWLGDQKFHDSHKSNLLRKDPVYYSQFGWDVPDNLPYIWPV